MTGEPRLLTQIKSENTPREKEVTSDEQMENVEETRSESSLERNTIGSNNEPAVENENEEISATEEHITPVEAQNTADHNSEHLLIETEAVNVPENQVENQESVNKITQKNAPGENTESNEKKNKISQGKNYLS